MTTQAEVADDPGRMAKRSVVLAGHRTSVSLEQAFWDALKRLAAADGCSVNALVGRVDRDRRGNLSSALRVYVLGRLTDPSGSPSAGP